VQAKQHLRRFIAEIIDKTVVQPAIARAGIERDVGNFQRPQRVGDDIAAELRGVDAGLNGTFDARGTGCSFACGRQGILPCFRRGLAREFYLPPTIAFDISSD
jgi:hypothetical protein